MRTLIFLVILSGCCSAQDWPLANAVCANGKCALQKVLTPYEKTQVQSSVTVQTPVVVSVPTVTYTQVPAVKTTTVFVRRFCFRRK